jgi:hypothetical protein
MYKESAIVPGTVAPDPEGSLRLDIIMFTNGVHGCHAVIEVS